MSKNTQGKKRKLEGPKRAEGTHEEVLLADVREILANSNITSENAEPTTLPERFTEVQVTIESISSTGDGLGRASGFDHIFVVPFTAPGDVVTAKFVRYDKVTSCAITDLVKVDQPSPDRQDSLVRCPYFASCSGCQFQMLPYEKQLAHKKTIVDRAYRNFSGLPSDLVPAVADTIGSPLQYGYRTKLTPHFDGPPGGRRAGRHGLKAHFGDVVPPIGFMKKGVRQTLDIEECPIGTTAVQMGLRRERKRVVAELYKYQRGATILLRESTERLPRAEVDAEPGIDEATQTVYEERDPWMHVKQCITDNKATTTEYIDNFTFQNLANSFFQNNNSILPIFTSYIRDHAKAPPSTGISSTPSTSHGDTLSESKPEIKNLIDAYCGSGLFTVTLSSLFQRTIGIDVDTGGIQYARLNAALNLSTKDPTKPLPNQSETLASNSIPSPTTNNHNNVPTFICADAAALFTSVPSTFDPSATVVIIDPPRKGCDTAFLTQLLAFGPARIVYVSCNVHTQARDVGWILREGKEGENEGEKKGDPRDGTYEIESLQGFDFFPQTGHVEGVAVLRRK